VPSGSGSYAGRQPSRGERRLSTDPSSIWEKARPRPRPGRARPSATPTPAPGRPIEDRPASPARVTLKEASRRYGVSVGTLGAWCRAGEVDAVMAAGPRGRQWMVTAASVAARRRRRGTRPAAGPTPEGNAMLVPRDAWDRLLAQLGNLHQAGQQLAEARERAARAETEASFLRERLAELRQERDLLREHLGTPSGTPRRRRFRFFPPRREQ
jgi:hypothetical protein